MTEPAPLQAAPEPAKRAKKDHRGPPRKRTDREGNRGREPGPAQARVLREDLAEMGAMTRGHHVIYQQRVRSAGGDLADPRNLMEVEDDEHECHHNRSRPFQLSRLPDSAFEFAVELLGRGAAYNYLRRRYAGDDPRLSDLLGCSKCGGSGILIRGASQDIACSCNRDIKELV